MLVMYHATFFAEHSLRAYDPNTWSLGSLAIWLLRRLWIGVPIFFVVSGYCIAASVDAGRGKAHCMRTYLTRRFRRIYPPLWAACLACVLFLSVIAHVDWLRHCAHQPVLGKFTIGNWFGNFFALESWRTHVSGGHVMYLMKNTWTLCYEEQFYFVVGLLLLASAPRFFSLAAAVTIATLTARHVARAAGFSAKGYFFDGHWLLFAIGIAVYYRLHRARPEQRRVIDLSFVAFAVYALVDRFLTTSSFERHLDHYLIVSSVFGLLLIVLFGKDEQLCESPWLRPFAGYGKISYSVYLTHFPVMIAVAATLSHFGTRADGFTAFIIVPACVLGSIPLGRAFFLAVERRFLNSPAGVERAAASQRTACAAQLQSEREGDADLNRFRQSVVRVAVRLGTDVESSFRPPALAYLLLRCE